MVACMHMTWDKLANILNQTIYSIEYTSTNTYKLRWTFFREVGQKLGCQMDSKGSYLPNTVINRGVERYYSHLLFELYI